MTPRPRLLGLLTIGVLLAGCNAAANDGGDGGGSDGGGGTDGPSLVLVTPNPVGVNDFLKLAVAGVEDAAKEHGGSQKVYQSTDPASLQQNVAAAVRDKPDVIVAVGFNFADVLAQQAEQNPDQQFLFVDSCTEKAYPNVTCAVFREYEGVYLAGAEAALLSKSGKVGAVVALDTPQFRRYSTPFGEGAAKVKPTTTLSPLFIGGANPFNDPGRAKQLTATLAGQGVDHVMGAASASGNLGVFEAAKEHGIFAFGVDANQCPASPGQVVDNVIKRTDVVITDGVSAILDGERGEARSYGVKEEGISLTGLQQDAASSQCVIVDHPDVIEQVGTLRDDIVAGTITVADPAQG
ncbi:BMP family ABC transporter substrate-binding protein [Actinophytocola xinjiangensis]|uniref:BMP family ABC transporter substrate-binding protein n=1 Tax=Actinophytocola xinjiangensis TaxID=485602 RepID=A0A7Z0WRP9_9PSEU|nr:BMP family ABC transporter substrate-binding protein [Actinophytocola xinjiangensis]OLF13110.1 BMP family ABC transporter substrate-binding protein [Actinophytocola xinjiangensis]